MTKDRLDVVIIPMQFPAPSETFISSRLRTLVVLGHRLRVFALRGSVAGDRQLARERAVDTIPTSHNGPVASLRGVLQALRRPVLFADSLAWLFRTTRGNRSQLFRALVVLPRSFDILDRLEHDPPDVLHAEWGHYPTIVARLVQQRLPRTVVSISLIAYDLTTEFGGTVDVVKNADVIRTQTRANVSHISRFVGIAADRIAVIHDGVEFARIRRVYGHYPKIAGRCVVAGRLVPAKGIDDAIRVFASARAKLAATSLRVLGTGPDLARLQRLVNELGVGDAVEFLGHVSHDQVIQELAQAEILLHLSQSERLPNVVKEAMACRCAIVTTRTVGIEELVQHGVTGFIVEHGDVEAAISLVVSLLGGGISPTEVGDAAYQFITENFDHERSVRRLVSQWNAALPAHSQTSSPSASSPLDLTPSR